MKVSADHRFPEHACKDRDVKIGYDRFENKFHVSIEGYGCSKNYDTAEQAVRAMLADHACFNVRVTQ